MADQAEVMKRITETINERVAVGTFLMDGSSPIPFAGPGQYMTSRICGSCNRHWAILFEVLDDAPPETAGPPWHFEFTCRDCAAPGPMQA